MLIYAGIDEAGYGPMLGPLCVACTVFAIDDMDAGAEPCDLWKRLRKAVCRKRTDRRRRIAIDDSKQLKLPNDAAAHPLRHLERGVLAFLGAREQGCPDCDDQLFTSLSAACCGAEWYRSTTSLPVASTADELRIASSRLRLALSCERISCDLMRCETIDAEAFNSQVEMMHRKSSVNFCAAMRLVDAVWRRWPAHHPHIVIDRQGGRMRYVDELLAIYSDARIQILNEDEVVSRYRLERDGSVLTVSFMVDSETEHLPVALASMIAKYVRELMMLRLNRYFQALMPELKATAGYTEDARRYIAEIEGLIDRLGVDRKRLIRVM